MIKDNETVKNKMSVPNRLTSKFPWLWHVLFVASVIVASRTFLGFDLGSHGRKDVMTSFAMILLMFLLVERFTKGIVIVRKIAMVTLGLLLIFFHLLNGAYYRFFHVMLPFDIGRQIKDLFVVGGDGFRLISTRELFLVIVLPLVSLVFMVRKPLRPRTLGIVIVFCIAVFGWILRLNHTIHRPVKGSAALPRFIHESVYRRLKFSLSRSRFEKSIRNIDSIMQSSRDGYTRVAGRGVLLQPTEEMSAQIPRKYNIIIILMESFRAYECGFLGAEPSFTPCLDRLTKKAKIYDNFYANGSQTTRGELATLCSIYPNPVGVSAYLVNPNLDLISLPQILQDLGYETLWFSGYTAEAGNKRAFLSKHGIEKIIDRDVLPPAQKPFIGWGMDDEELFQNVWDILKECNQPFFAQITTLSNHYGESTYPTDSTVPKVDGSPRYDRYAKGVYYTDYTVAGFVEKVLDSELAWSTLIVITGDHGIWLFPSGIDDAAQKREIYFRSPLCIWGPPDVVEPGVDHTLGSQVDIAPTLTQMLNIYRPNTFLASSLVNKQIPQEQRYVITYLGNIGAIRRGSVYMLPDQEWQDKQMGDRVSAQAQKMDFQGNSADRFVVIEGDLLRGEYQAIPLANNNQTDMAAKILEDMTYLVTYGIYFDAFEGAH